VTAWRLIATAVVITTHLWSPPLGGPIRLSAGETSPKPGEGGKPDPTQVASQPTRTSNDAVFTAEQAKRGEILYQFICASCHGGTLTGIEAAPPLAGATFSASWTGAALGDLFERIRVSMPQNKPGSLGRQQAADVVAYILSFNKAPAGQTELPGDAEALKSITIVAAQ
jgi:mono/diheme cytochrome c family protein